MGKSLACLGCLVLLGNFTRESAITLAGPPAITKQPANVTISEVETATFSITAEGTGSLTYRWQSSTDGATWSNVSDTCTTLSSLCHLPPQISGAATTTLSISQWSISRPSTSFRCVVTNSDGSVTSTAATLKVVSAVTVSPASLRFSGTKTASASSFTALTPPQTVTVTIAGTGNRWAAASSDTWLQVTGGSGTGGGQFVVTVVNPSNAIGASSSLTGKITITSPSASFAFVDVPVTLTVLAPGTTAPPFGAFDTPANGATGLQGSVALTGWALDDVGVDRVELWRDLQAGETTPPFAGGSDDPRAGKVFLGNGLFVDDARSDIEKLYPSTPLNRHSGWGYLMLTWGLWNSGNGVYIFYAYAFDKDGKFAALGQKTVTIDNAHATKPFGSIDGPGVGATVSGIATNNGWGLTPKVNGVATCKIGANGVQVSIDSGPLQAVAFGDARADIASAFAGFSNGAAAGGHVSFDTTTLTNGSHTIGWLITDDCNRADGVGSRFFNVSNGSALTARADQLRLKAETSSDAGNEDAILVAHGYGNLPAIVDPDAGGQRTIHIAQGERIEVRLPRDYAEAYQDVDGAPRTLPVGTTWDAVNGILYWQPAPAFLGTYQLIFSNGRERISIRVVVTP